MLSLEVVSLNQEKKKSQGPFGHDSAHHFTEDYVTEGRDHVGGNGPSNDFRVLSAQIQVPGWGHRSMVERFPSALKALGSTSTEKSPGMNNTKSSSILMSIELCIREGGL